MERVTTKKPIKSGMIFRTIALFFTLELISATENLSVAKYVTYLNTYINCCYDRQLTS